MYKDYLLFDLDGTLTDPKIGITKSVQYSLRSFGIMVDDPDDLIAFIGPPLRESYKQYYSFTDDQAEKAVEEYRVYFSEHGIYENTMYAGIDHMLDALCKHDKTLIVATSKPTVFAKRILQHFNIDGYFTFVSGSELDGSRSKKELVIRYAFENAGVTENHRAIMIGDREHDIIGAKKVGISSIGVLYGYGDYEELRSAGADTIVKSVQELSDVLLNC